MSFSACWWKNAAWRERQSPVSSFESSCSQPVLYDVQWRSNCCGNGFEARDILSVRPSQLPEDECRARESRLKDITYSIVIPAYNEGARLGATLEKVLKYVREQGWNAEVIVVNDGSRDNTAELG